MKNSNPEMFREDQTQRQANMDAKLRGEENDRFKDQQAKRKANSDAKPKESNPEHFKVRQAKRKRLSRNKRKLENPKSLSHLEIEAQIKKKKNWNERDRLRDFNKALQPYLYATLATEDSLKKMLN